MIKSLQKNKLINIIVERKGFITYMFLRISSMVLGLVTNIIIIRKLSVEEFGIYSVALLVVNLVTTFGFSWSSSSILYFGSREREMYGNLNKTFWSRNLIIFVSLIVSTFGIIVFRDFINNYIGLNIWFLLLLWLYVSVTENYLNQYFLAVKKQLTSSMILITSKLIFIAIILLFQFDVITLIIIYIISHSTVLFYILAINRNDIGKFEFDRNWFKQVLNFSLWQLFGFSGIYLLNFGDIAVVKYFMTNKDVGLYNAAYQLFGATAGFSYVISSYYASNVSSYFVSENKIKIKMFFVKERLIVIGASLLAHIIVLLFSKQIITLLYGQEYIPAIPIFNTLMLGSIISYITVFYTLYYNTNGKHHIQQIINIIVSILNVGLSIIFIKIFGLIGPAIATVVTLVFSLMFSFWYCEKRIKKFVLEGD